MDVGIFLAEFLGTFIVVLSILATRNILFISAVFLTTITIISKISGGHINPVVSLVMFMNGTITSKQLMLFIPAQIAGAVAAYYAYNAYYKNK